MKGGDDEQDNQSIHSQQNTARSRSVTSSSNIGMKRFMAEHIPNFILLQSENHLIRNAFETQDSTLVYTSIKPAFFIDPEDKVPDAVLVSINNELTEEMLEKLDEFRIRKVKPGFKPSSGLSALPSFSSIPRNQQSHNILNQQDFVFTSSNNVTRGSVRSFHNQTEHVNSGSKFKKPPLSGKFLEDTQQIAEDEELHLPSKYVIQPLHIESDSENSGNFEFNASLSAKNRIKNKSPNNSSNIVRPPKGSEDRSLNYLRQRISNKSNFDQDNDPNRSNSIDDETNPQVRKKGKPAHLDTIPTEQENNIVQNGLTYITFEQHPDGTRRNKSTKKTLDPTDKFVLPEVQVYSNKNQDSHLSPYHNATKELRIRFKRAVQAHDRSRNRKERESSEQKETRETGSVQREPVYLNVRDNSYDSRDAHFLKSRPFLLNNKPREPRARYVVNRSKDLLNNSKEGIVVIDSTCRDINMSKDSFIAAHPGSRQDHRFKTPDKSNSTINTSLWGTKIHFAKSTRRKSITLAKPEVFSERVESMIEVPRSGIRDVSPGIKLFDQADIAKSAKIFDDSMRTTNTGFRKNMDELERMMNNHNKFQEYIEQYERNYERMMDEYSKKSKQHNLKKFANELKQFLIERSYKDNDGDMTTMTTMNQTRSYFWNNAHTRNGSMPSNELLPLITHAQQGIDQLDKLKIVIPKDLRSLSHGRPGTTQTDY